MRPGVYKHANNTEVAAKVVKSFWIPEKKGWKVKILWLNIVNPKNVYLIDHNPESHFISRESAKMWKVYDALV